MLYNHIETRSKKRKYFEYILNHIILWDYTRISSGIQIEWRSLRTNNRAYLQLGLSGYGILQWFCYDLHIQFKFEWNPTHQMYICEHRSKHLSIRAVRILQKHRPLWRRVWKYKRNNDWEICITEQRNHKLIVSTKSRPLFYTYYWLHCIHQRILKRKFYMKVLHQWIYPKLPFELITRIICFLVGAGYSMYHQNDFSMNIDLCIPMRHIQNNNNDDDTDEITSWTWSTDSSII